MSQMTHRNGIKHKNESKAKIISKQMTYATESGDKVGHREPRVDSGNGGKQEAALTRVSAAERWLQRREATCSSC